MSLQVSEQQSKQYNKEIILKTKLTGTSTHLTPKNKIN